jgi:hypothetical protein
MEWSLWLQGGPFLEVSFLLKHKGQRTKNIQSMDLK